MTYENDNKDIVKYRKYGKNSKSKSDKSNEKVAIKRQNRYGEVLKR